MVRQLAGRATVRVQGGVVDVVRVLVATDGTEFALLQAHVAVVVDHVTVRRGTLGQRRQDHSLNGAHVPDYLELEKCLEGVVFFFFFAAPICPKRRPTADMNNVSLVCFGTHINSSAKNTMCISSDEPTRNNKPIVRYIHAFCKIE